MYSYPKNLKITVLTVHGIQAGRREVYTTLHNKYGIPQHEIEALASCILPKIQEFFASEEGRKEFEEWKQKQEKEMK